MSKVQGIYMRGHSTCNTQDLCQLRSCCTTEQTLKHARQADYSFQVISVRQAVKEDKIGTYAPEVLSAINSADEAVIVACNEGQPCADKLEVCLFCFILPTSIIDSDTTLSAHRQQQQRR